MSSEYVGGSFKVGSGYVSVDRGGLRLRPAGSDSDAVEFSWDEVFGVLLGDDLDAVLSDCVRIPVLGSIGADGRVTWHVSPRDATAVEYAVMEVEEVSE